MPWCDECSRFWNPTTLTAAGECPACNRVIAEPPRVPWHFKALVGAAALYLTWRAVQGVGWGVDWVVRQF